MTPTKEQLRMILTKAIAAPLGISQETSSPERLRTKLYNTRRKYAPEYDSLSFTVSPVSPETHLWIISNARVD